MQFFLRLLHLILQIAPFSEICPYTLVEKYGNNEREQGRENNDNRRCGAVEAQVGAAFLHQAIFLIFHFTYELAGCLSSFRGHS